MSALQSAWRYCTTVLVLLGLQLLVMLVAFGLWTLRMTWSALASHKRAWELLASGDQLGNAAFNGDRDMTISQRAALARNEGKRWGCRLCRWLDWVDDQHCDKSLVDGRKQ